jgi:hypothetical protein
VKPTPRSTFIGTGRSPSNVGRTKATLQVQVFEACATRLTEALERGTVAWPLPSPPLVDPDFPPLPPNAPADVTTSGLALLEADRGTFERHLDEVVDLVVPQRMSLSDDPYEVHGLWLNRRVDDLAERIVYRLTTAWLSQALDREAPNTDRWWLAVALLNGLAQNAHGQAVHEGYHLLESIALAQRPGTWHTQPDVGPQHLGWNPHAVVPRTTDVEAHTAGTEAASWMLDRLESGDLDRRLLLIRWCELLLERPPLVEPLGLIERLKRRANDPEAEVAARVCTCLARLVERSLEGGLDVVHALHARDDLEVRRALADVLTRLFRRVSWEAVPLLEAMLDDDDESVLAAASATMHDLRFLDEDRWIATMKDALKHPAPVVRRNVVAGLREYVERRGEDQDGLLALAWSDGDEVVRTRLRELLLRMDEVAPEHLEQVLRRTQQGAEALLASIDARRDGRGTAWRAYLNGEGDRPVALVAEPVRAEPHDMTEVPAPELGDALDLLDDDLGFLD